MDAITIAGVVFIIFMAWLMNAIGPRKFS